MKRIFLKARCALLILILAFSVLVETGFSSNAAYKLSESDIDIIEAFAALNIKPDFSDSENIRVSSRFHELIFGKKEKQTEIMLCPSGDAFGILIKEDGVTVCSSQATGILSGDRIVKIGNRDCTECKDVYEAVRGSGGAPLNITLIRDEEKISVTATPKYKDGEYMLGITLRSQTAGIGTITFVDPQTLAFGGLGHAVSDSETGKPVSVKQGIASGVSLGACKKGTIGKAGELSGILNRTPIGAIFKNTECGVFGELQSLPQNVRDPMPIAHNSEVKCGNAEIISTIKNGMTDTYKIEISDIDTNSTGSKSFKIKVTDPALIALTGGIVRGMSGSPVIQDGKLVGAVTHVMVADPTEGYGIFIENMLNAAQTQVQPKAA